MLRKLKLRGKNDFLIKKTLHMCYFGYFKYAWPQQPQITVLTCGKLYVNLHAKNQLHPSLLLWDIAKIMKTCYLGTLTKNDSNNS